MEEKYVPLKGTEIEILMGDVIKRDDNESVRFIVTGTDSVSEQIFIANTWTCIKTIFDDFRFLSGAVIGRISFDEKTTRSHDNLDREEFLLTTAENCKNVRIQYAKEGRYNGTERTVSFKTKEELTASHVWKHHFNWFWIKEQFSKDGLSFEQFSDEAEPNCANVMYLHDNDKWDFSRMTSLSHLLDNIKDDNNLHKYKLAKFTNLRSSFNQTLDVQVSNDAHHWVRRTLVNANPRIWKPYETLTSKRYERWDYCRVEEFSRDNIPPNGTKFRLAGITGLHTVLNIEGKYINTEAGHRFIFPESNDVVWSDL